MGRRVRFGPFELDRQTGELWKHGLKLKLQGKPFQVLEALIERPGEPVSREELQQKLWTGDTFVDFESGLNTAANRLRLALGDSAENPRYVETLARSGYRFVARVEEVIEPSVAVPPAESSRWAIPVAVAALVVVAGIAAWWATHRPPSQAPAFQQVTFRRGPLGGARFAPDGQTILYSAKWGAEPWNVFLASSVSPETRTLGFERSALNAVSASGELALLSRDGVGITLGAKLSRVPMNGGSPLAVSERVVCSDWSPNGKELAVVRFEGFDTQLEFPIGKVLYRTPNLMSCLRVSRDGGMIAFMEHPVRGDDAGEIKVVDLGGKVRTLSAGWASARGLAWSASGKEVWFTAARMGGRRALWAVTLDGKVRLVSRVPGSLRLEDIFPDGRVLVAQQDERAEMWGRVGNDPAERDLSWFDWSAAVDLSVDGKLLLFGESGEGGGANWTVYLRSFGDDSVTRLAEGHALALAPNGRSALVLNTSDRRRVTLVPVGEGQHRELSGAGIEYHLARFFPDGQSLLVTGNEPGSSLRLYRQAINGGKPRPLTPDIYLTNLVISPDGKQIAGTNGDNKLVILPADGGQPRLLQTEPNGLPVSWSTDGRSLLIRGLRSVPAHLYRVDVLTGRTKLWREIGPANAQGFIRLLCTPDEKSYVYSFVRSQATLFVTTGLK